LKIDYLVEENAILTAIFVVSITQIRNFKEIFEPSSSRPELDSPE